MTKEKGPEAIEMTEEELNDFRKRIEDKQLLETDYAHIGKMIEFVIWVQIKLQQSKISLNNLKRLLFGKSSEKSAKTAEENVSTELMSSMNMQTEGLEKPERSILPSSEKKSLKKMGTAGWRGARTRRVK